MSHALEYIVLYGVDFFEKVLALVILVLKREKEATMNLI